MGVDFEYDRSLIVLIKQNRDISLTKLP